MSKPKRTTDATPSFLSGEQRINKLLAAAGLGSRRQVDELITEGRVEIDGQVISQVGVKVDADKAKILVDGEPLKRHRPVYYAVHKPAGVLCTNSDPEGRPRVIDLVPAQARLFPVGRLDASSTGLILLTNDGELAQRLAHPKHCVPKTYFVVVAGQVEKEAMRRLQRGIYLAEGVARVDGATIRKVRKGCTEIDITLSEGKNREIRRVLARLGHKVVVLRRTSIGPLKLADMPEGAYRPLQDKEVAALYQAVEEIKKARNQDRRERKKRNTENELAPSSPRSGKPPAGKPSRPPVFNEDGGDWNEDDEFEADSMMDTLPPMSKNPFRTADDEDAEEEGFDDAILVTDFNAPEVYSNKRGAVLSYDDEAGLHEFVEDGIEGLLESSDEDSGEETARPKRPRGGNGGRGSDRRPTSRGPRERSTGERSTREGDSPYRRSSATAGRGAPRYGQRSRSSDGPSEGSADGRVDRRRKPGPGAASRGGRGRGGPGAEGRSASTGSPYSPRPSSGASRPEYGAGDDRPQFGGGGRRPPRSGAPRSGGSSPYGTRRSPSGTSGEGRPARGPSGGGRPSSGGGRPISSGDRLGGDRLGGDRPGGDRPGGAGRPGRGGKPGSRPSRPTGKPGGKRFGGGSGGRGASGGPGGGKTFSKKRRP